MTSCCGSCSCRRFDDCRCDCDCCGGWSCGGSNFDWPSAQLSLELMMMMMMMVMLMMTQPMMIVITGLRYSYSLQKQG